jgi:CelD/BcsL family acetyltransferase involved in cellulose biosynthesis
MTNIAEKDGALGDHSITVIRRIEDFKKLKPVWDELATNEGSYFPYLCFDYFKIWLEHFLGNDNLLILNILGDGRVLAIAPFVVKEERYKGVKTTKVELIGNAYSPIRSFISARSEKEDKEAILLTILEFFRKSYTRWDVIDLNSIIEEHGNLSLVESALNRCKLKYRGYFCFGNCFEDGIESPSDGYFGNLSKNFRASIRKNINRAHSRGKLQFKMVTESEGLETFIEEYVSVYSKSWKEKERAGPNYLVSHLKDLADKGWLRLGLLYFDNAPIAAGFGAVYDGVAYLEKTAYNEEYEDIGAGKLWYREMIKYLIDVDKTTCLDFLIGDYEYKKNWLSRRRERGGFLIFNRNIRGTYLRLLIMTILPYIQEHKRLRKVKEFIASPLLRRGRESL